LIATLEEFCVNQAALAAAIMAAALFVIGSSAPAGSDIVCGIYGGTPTISGNAC